MSLNRRSLAMRVPWLLSLATALLACADPATRMNPPGTDQRAFSLDVSLMNDQSEAILIPWQVDHPKVDLSIRGKDLLSEPTCLPPCDQSCFCGECPTSLGEFLRIPAKTTFALRWTPKRYVRRACEGREGCFCVDEWPLTTGTYDVTITGFTRPVGGKTVEGKENLLLGATPGEDSATCWSKFSFSVKNAEAEAKFMCPAPR